MWKCRYLFKYLHIYEPLIIFRIIYPTLLSRQCESGCAWPNPLSCTVMQHKHAQWLISARDTKRYTLTQGHSGDWRWHSNFNIRSFSTTHRSQHGSGVNYWCWIMRIVDQTDTPTYVSKKVVLKMTERKSGWWYVNTFPRHWFSERRLKMCQPSIWMAWW